MADFLLPCQCGRQTPVSVAQAGQSIRCACGAELHIPTLRGLKELPRHEPAAAQTAKLRTWTNRHRLILALLIVGVAFLAVGGYLAAHVPELPQSPSLAEIEAHFAGTSPQQLLDTYNELRKGLVQPTGRGNELALQRTMTIWTAGITLAVGGLCLLAAGLLATFGSSRRARPAAK